MSHNVLPHNTSELPTDPTAVSANLRLEVALVVNRRDAELAFITFPSVSFSFHVKNVRIVFFALTS